MKEKLHPTHIAILIYMTQAAVIILSLPRILAENFGTNGWLALIPATLLSSFNIFLISLVYRLGKGRSVFDILERSVPKALLYPIYLAAAAVWIMAGCMIGKEYILIFQMIAFPTTHPMIFKLAVDVIVFYLVLKGIYNIAKASTTFYFLVIWMLGLLVAFLPEYEWSRLTPFIFRDSGDMIKGAVETYSAYIGYELSMFLFPFFGRNPKAMKAVYIGNLMTALTYLSICFIAFGFYHYRQLANLVFPLLDLLAYIELPFIERMENLLFGFLLFTSLITVTMYTWTATEAVKRIFPQTGTGKLALVMLAAAYGIAFFPDVIGEVHQWLQWAGNVELSIAFGLPLLLIMLLLYQRTRRKEPSGDA
jgi:Spore germination protein.